MTTGLWLIALAPVLAGHVEAGAQVQGTAGEVSEVGPNAGGVSLWGGWAFADRLRLEGAADVGLGGDLGPSFGLRAETRWYATPPWAPRGALSVIAGVGVHRRASLAPVLALGASVDLTPRGRWSPRIQARYLVGLDTGSIAASLQLGAGLAWGRPTEPPQVTLAEPPAPPLPSPLRMPPPPEAALADFEPGPDLLETRPAGTPVKVWIPHPFCEWVDEAEAEALLGQLEDLQQVRVESPGFLPAHIEVDPARETPAPVELEPAPAQGSVLVVANRGDVVRAAGYEVPASRDGLVVFNAPEGPVEVIVRGGGRDVILAGRVTNGYALWMRVDQPSEVRVFFDVGSSRLRPRALESIRELADRAGGYDYQLQGSFSPEGDPTFNQRLARARATAVTNALLAAGVPEEAIYSVPPPEEQVEGDAVQQRACLVTPVERGSRPEPPVEDSEAPAPAEEGS